MWKLIPHDHAEPSCQSYLEMNTLCKAYRVQTSTSTSGMLKIFLCILVVNGSKVIQQRICLKIFQKTTTIIQIGCLTIIADFIAHSIVLMLAHRLRYCPTLKQHWLNVLRSLGWASWLLNVKVAWLSLLQIAVHVLADLFYRHRHSFMCIRLVGILSSCVIQCRSVSVSQKAAYVRL